MERMAGNTDRKTVSRKFYWSSVSRQREQTLRQRTGYIRFSGIFFNDKAIELYRLPGDAPIAYMPTPSTSIRIRSGELPKKNHILFIGRIESIKRWLFCEIAKQLPQYEFFMLGQTFRENPRTKVSWPATETYRTFACRTMKAKKMKYIREAKTGQHLHPRSAADHVSGSLRHTAGQLPQSGRSDFEIRTLHRSVLGDGFDKVPLFTSAIEEMKTRDCAKNYPQGCRIHPGNPPVHKFKST
ncbi:MAG: hypothetical protein ACLRMJ_03495 [Alistipes finegoldii]